MICLLNLTVIIVITENENISRRNVLKEKDFLGKAKLGRTEISIQESHTSRKEVRTIGRKKINKTVLASYVMKKDILLINAQTEEKHRTQNSFI